MIFLPEQWTLVFYIINFINLIFIFFVLFFERREPGRRMGWLLALIFVPIGGMVFYLLFSGHFFTHNKKMQKARVFVNDALQPWLNKQREYLRTHATDLQQSEIKRFIRLVDMNIVYGNSLLTWTDSLQVYCWGQDMFVDFCQDLENASSSIHLEYFIFRNDTIGKKILEILCRKARSGVEVKLMYDDLGSFFVPTSFFKPLIEAGGEVRPFFPVRFVLPVSANFRNHRKIAVIDGLVAYMGGINIGDEYLNQKRSGRCVLWRDTHVRMTGASVQSLQIIFLIDWFSITKRMKTITSLEDARKYFPLDDFDMISKDISENTALNIVKQPLEKKLIPTQILMAGPDEIDKEEIRDAMIRMIMSARKSVYIQTPYFTPDESFFSALRIAAVSGIDVRIMVPGVWDKFYVRAAAYPYIRMMLDFGVKFYSYPGFIHAKTIVVDGSIVTVGSTNIDNRSFNLHFEVNAFFYDRLVARDYQRVFLKDQKMCSELTSDWFASRFILRRAWWGFCNLFSPLL